MASTNARGRTTPPSPSVATNGAGGLNAINQQGQVGTNYGVPPGRTGSAPANLNSADAQQVQYQQQAYYGYAPRQPGRQLYGMPPHMYYQQPYMMAAPGTMGLSPPQPTSVPSGQTQSPQLTGQKDGTSPSHIDVAPQVAVPGSQIQARPGMPVKKKQQQGPAIPPGQAYIGQSYPRGPMPHMAYPAMYGTPSIPISYAGQMMGYPSMHPYVPQQQQMPVQTGQAQPIQVREKKILEIRNPKTNEKITPSPVKQESSQASRGPEIAIKAAAESAQVTTDNQPALNAPIFDARAELLARTKAALQQDKEAKMIRESTKSLASDDSVKEAQQDTKQVKEPEASKQSTIAPDTKEKQSVAAGSIRLNAGAPEESNLLNDNSVPDDRKSREEEAQKKMMEKAAQAAALKQRLDEEQKQEERKRKEREAKLRMEEIEQQKLKIAHDERESAKDQLAIPPEHSEEPRSGSNDSEKKVSEDGMGERSKVTGKITYSILDLLKFKEEFRDLPSELSPEKIDMQIIRVDNGNRGGDRGGTMRNAFGRPDLMRGGPFRGAQQAPRPPVGRTEAVPMKPPQWVRGNPLPGPPRGQPVPRHFTPPLPQPPLVQHGLQVKPIERSENAWRPQQSQDQGEETLRQVTQVLNKLSREKFDRLTAQLVSLKMLSLNMLERLVELIRNKALTEPKFGDLYADLCKLLVESTSPKGYAAWHFIHIVEKDGAFYWTTSEDEGAEDYMKGPYKDKDTAEKSATKSTELRRILLNQCQEEFEKEDHYEELDKKKKALEKTLDSCSDEEEQNKIKLEIAEIEYQGSRLKQRILGNIQFIGELFKKEILTARVMMYCVSHLVGQDARKTPPEENVECLCKLLITVGRELEIKTSEKEETKDFVDHVFSFLAVYAESKNLDARHRFMCKDVIELRSSNWQARREELKAKTKKEIREDVANEEAEKQRQANVANLRQQSQGRKFGDRGRGDRPGLGPGTSVMGSVAHTNSMATGFRLGGSDPRARMSMGSQDVRGFQSKITPGQRAVVTTPSATMPRTSLRPGGLSGAGVVPSRPGATGTLARPTGGLRPGGLGMGSRPSIKPPSARPATSEQSRAPGSSKNTEEPKLSRSELKHKVIETIKEYVHTQLESELVGYMEDLAPLAEDKEKLKELFVEECAGSILEKGDEERRYVPRAITSLSRARFLTEEHICAALGSFTEFIPDIKVDAPLADTHFGNFLADLILDGNLKLSSVPRCLENLYSVDMSVSVKIVSVLLASLARDSMGRSLVGESDVSISKLLGDQASEEHVNLVLSESGVSSLFPCDSTNEQEELKRLIQRNADVDEILRWIEANVSISVLQDKDFARFVVTTVLEHIEKTNGVLSNGGSPTSEPSDEDCSREAEGIKSYARLMKRVTRNESADQKQLELQVHCLDGVANLLDSVDFPPGMPKRLFRELYSNEIFQEEAYILWKDSGKKKFPQKSHEYQVHEKTVIKCSDWLHWLENAQEESDASSIN